MNVIAFACHPQKGSEEGVGWNWVLVLSKIFPLKAVYVVDGYLKDCKLARPDIPFRSGPGSSLFDPSSSMGRFLNRPIFKLFIHWSVRRWMKSIVSYEIAENRSTDFFLLTYVGLRFGDIFLNEDINFFWGPVGGALTTPSSLLKDLSTINRSVLVLRNVLVEFEKKKIGKSFANKRVKAIKVLAAGPNTKIQLESLFNTNIDIVPEISLDFTKIEQRRRNEKSNELKILVNAQKFSELKGALFCARLLQRLISQTNYYVKFGIIGEVTRSTLSKFPINERFEIEIFGAISRKEVAPVLAQYDFFWHFSYLDLTATALVEAAASGLVCCAFDIHEFRNVIVPSKTGLLVNPLLDIEERITIVADFVRAVQSDPIMYDSLSIQAMNLSKDRFNLCQLSHRLERELNH